MLDLRLEAEVPRGALEVRRHDVPSNPALGKVVDGGEAARQRVGRIVRGARRDAEEQVAGRGGHGRDGVERVVDGELRARRQGRVDVGRALVDVVGPQRVRDEHGVEAGLVQRLRQRRPEAQLVVVGCLVPRVLPQTR